MRIITNHILSTEALASKIGWTPQQAIGRTINKESVDGPVVGVIKNFEFQRVFMIRIRSFLLSF